MPLNLHLLRMFATVIRQAVFRGRRRPSMSANPRSQGGKRLRAPDRLPPAGPRPKRRPADARGTGADAPRRSAFCDGARGRRRDALAPHPGEGSLRIGEYHDRFLHDRGIALGIFHNAHPNIDLHIISANTREIADMTIAHEVDIALVEGPVKDENLIQNRGEPTSWN